MIRHLAVLSCIASLAVSAETGVNVLVNGGFEDISDNGKPKGWACGREWRVAEREGVDGSRALVYDNADPGKPSTPRQNVQLEKGRTYAIEADIRIDGTLKGPYGKGVCVYAEWYGVSNKWLGGVYTDEIKTTAGGWRHVSAISSAIKTNAVCFSVGIGIGKGCTGKVAIDNVKLSRWYNPRLQGLYSSAYRNLAVDGEVEFMAALDMTDGSLASYSGRFTWTGADGRLHTAEPMSMDEEFARLTMDVRGLAVGRSKVKFELIKKADGGIDGFKEIAFERSTEMPSRSVTVDSRHRAVVDGKPFFPIGVYGGLNSMAQLKEIGINTLMLYGAPGWDYLECARTNGFKIIAGVNHVFADMKHAPSCVRTEADELAWMEKYVSSVRFHPALLAWYALDELPLTMLPRLSARRDLLERLDPNHPVWVCLNHPHQTRSYLPAFDISGSDPYPVPRDPIVTAARWTKATVRGCGGRRAVWMVPQIFNWANYGRRDSRVPTRDEIRNMTWQCIAEGATGLIYFKWGDLMNNGPDTTFEGRFADFASVVREVRREFPFLLSDEPAPAVSWTSEMLCARTFVKGGNVRLLMVNASREPCKANVRVERAGCPAYETELAPLEVRFVDMPPAVLNR